MQVDLTSDRLIRDARERHGVTQATLARRAGTTQGQISRIERGEISPSVSTLARLLAALGERLELRALPGPGDTRIDADVHADVIGLGPGERVAQAASLSRTLTGIARGAR